MNFLDNLVIPQSAEHLQLLNYLLAISMLVLIPYLAILLGFSFLSANFYKKGLNEQKDDFFKIAKILIDSVTFNKVMIFGFGLIPLISTGLILVQVLYLTKLHIENYFYFSVILFLLAIVFIYSYKHSLSLYLVTKKLAGEDTDDYNEEIVKDYNERTKKINYNYPIWGVLLIIGSIYFLMAALQLAANNLVWNTTTSFWAVVFSINSLVYFLSFLALSLLLTFSLFILLLNKNEKYLSKEFLPKLAKTGLNGNLIAVVVYLLVITLKVFFTPLSGLSLDHYLLLILTFLFLAIFANQIYGMLKNNKLESVNSALFIVIIVVLLSVVQNTSAFSVSTNKEVINISEKYLVYQDEFKQSMGIVTAVVSGEDIYKGKCIACHAFDKKIVGPPYNEVLKKYEGKVDDLAKFILNPVKVNPDYPAMPNQGVKPSEAKAVAEYILSTYKK
jgi:cytochrome c